MRASRSTTNHQPVPSVWNFQRVGFPKDSENALVEASVYFPSRRLYSTASKIPANPKEKTPTTTSKTSEASKTSKSTKKASTKKPTKKAKRKVAPKPKRPTKKILTAEEKEKLATTKASRALRDLKVTALKPPKAKPFTAWMVIQTEYSKKEDGGVVKTIMEAAKQASLKYRSLTPSEIEVRKFS